MGMGIPAGLVLGVLLSFGAVKIFAVLNNVTMIYRFDVRILLVATVVCVICVFIALLIPAIRASKSTPIAGVGKGVFKRNHKAKNPRQQKRKLSPFSLMLISMRKSKGKILLTTVSFALVIAIFTFMMLFYLVAYQTPYEIADVTLSIPGATFIVQPDRASYVIDGETENDTVLLESMERVQNMASNVQQSIQVVPNFTCAIPFEEYDAYLNGCFLYDLQALGLRQENVESYQKWQYSFEEQQMYGYSAQEYLVSPAVTIFDENLLQMTSQYVVDGKIDVEAINSGEEIILTMPDYVLQLCEDKDGNGWSAGMGTVEDPPSNVEDDKIELYTKLCTNINWKAGDTLALTWVESNGESYEMYRKTVRIGAVVQQKIPLEGAQFVFGMIVGEQTLVNLGLPYETAYQHIYFSADADVAQTEAELQQFVTQNYPKLQFTTKTEATAFEQQIRRTVITAVSLVIVCLLALGFLGLVNTVSSRIHSRLHEIGLLRSIGMTKGQVYRMLVYEGAVFGVLSSLLGVAASCWILPMFKPYWMQTATPLYLALACVICIVLSVLTIFLPARNVLQNNPTEITHFR